MHNKDLLIVKYLKSIFLAILLPSIQGVEWWDKKYNINTDTEIPNSPNPYICCIPPNVAPYNSLKIS